MKDRKFWALYLLFLVGFASVMFAGVFYDMTHMQFDPMTISASGTGISAYILNTGNGYEVFALGTHARLITNVPFNMPVGQCFKLYFKLDLIQRSAVANVTVVEHSYCQETG
jgi:hypothetical protein